MCRHSVDVQMVSVWMFFCGIFNVSVHWVCHQLSVFDPSCWLKHFSWDVLLHFHHQKVVDAGGVLYSPRSTEFLTCPSCPGVILRDSHGVAQVRFVTGNKILRILKSKGLAPDLPEDLYHLIKKAVAVRKHLERNRKVSWSRPSLSILYLSAPDTGVCSVTLTDILCRVWQDKDAKFRLILIESRIHRLARYYKTKRVLAPNWK